ncbi:IBR domain-containing protein [Ceratobasidium theobromae]|uniref:IBR domain-containing protein n=1 Tax=Ceratobasidium theobromae TaxID=1582974 RepID=A0A5N5QN70_9AGAM|nr:IBR domain-containing protein [Ceratobasidium theobromae]
MAYVPRPHRGRTHHERPVGIIFPSMSPTTPVVARSPPPPPKPTCTVCLETRVRFPYATPTKRCAHKPDVCVDCLRSHVRAVVVDSGHVNVRCPAARCGSEMTYEDVCKAGKGDKALVERQVDPFQLSLTHSMLGMTRCYCDKPSVQIHRLYGAKILPAGPANSTLTAVGLFPLFIPASLPPYTFPDTSY